MQCKYLNHGRKCNWKILFLVISFPSLCYGFDERMRRGCGKESILKDYWYSVFLIRVYLWDWGKVITLIALSVWGLCVGDFLSQNDGSFWRVFYYWKWRNIEKEYVMLPVGFELRLAQQNSITSQVKKKKSSTNRFSIQTDLQGTTN